MEGCLEVTCESTSPGPKAGSSSAAAASPERWQSEPQRQGTQLPGEVWVLQAVLVTLATSRVV